MFELVKVSHGVVSLNEWAAAFIVICGYTLCGVPPFSRHK